MSTDDVPVANATRERMDLEAAFDALFERGAAWFREQMKAAKSAFAVWNEPNRATPAKTRNGRPILPGARGHWLLSTPDKDSWRLLTPEHHGTAAAVRLLREFRESEVANVPLGLAIWLAGSALTVGHAQTYLRICCEQVDATLSLTKSSAPAPPAAHAAVATATQREPQPLTTCIRKAGQSIDAATKARDELIPETGRAPSKGCWGWVRDNHYPKGQCPGYETWCRYIRKYYQSGDARTRVAGERAAPSRSIIPAKDARRG